MTNSANVNDAAIGLAALSICESLLLAMTDLKLLNETDAIGIVQDAASAHREAGTTEHQAALHREAATILDQIISSGNSIRRPS